jgi:hypothetical protein
MSTNDKLMGQDGSDELLGEAGLEGNDTPESPVEKTTPSSKPLANKMEHVFREDVSGLMECLFKKSCLKREEGIRIIWNASCAFLMKSGITLKLEGREYISLDVLQENHLIIGRRG